MFWHSSCQLPLERFGSDSHRVGSGVAWALWIATMMITLMATVGFAALNSADTTGGAARSRPKAQIYEPDSIGYVLKATQLQRPVPLRASRLNCNARSQTQRPHGVRLPDAAT